MILIILSSFFVISYNCYCASSSDLILSFIKNYQKNKILRVSSCRFLPSCSNYAIQSINLYGPFFGLLMGLDRIHRCNFLSKSYGFDPPERHFIFHNLYYFGYENSDYSFIKIDGANKNSDFTNEIEFANHLFSTGDFENAILEYKRFSFNQKENNLSIFSEFKTNECYFYLKNFNKALEGFRKLISNNDIPEIIRDYCFYYIGKIFYLENNFELSINYFSNITNKDSKLFLLAQLNKFLCFVRLRKFKEAYFVIDSLIKEYDISELLNRVFYHLENMKNLKKKSPILASLFSSVIPGLGKVYASNKEDGVFSFLYISFFGLLTYDFYNYTNSINFGFIVLSSFSFINYLSNIYGSADAAIQYNIKNEEEIIKSIEFEIFKYESENFNILYSIP